VRSYFGRTGDGRQQTHFLVPRVRDVDVIATTTVKEALLLENQLIKRHKPRFNVKLRDDKNYLGLRIDPREPYPRFTETRRFLRDAALYFGPFTSSTSMHDTLDELQKLFPLRTCSDAVFRSYRNRGRPCLEHPLGRCVAPCCGRIEDAAYAELVRGAVLFLRGRAKQLLRTLRQRMRAAGEAERFEEAARLRDRIEAIERTVERQAMISTRPRDRDAFGLAREGTRLEVQTLHVRQGKLIGGKAHPFRDVHLDDAEALASFVGQFYAGERDIPSEVLLPCALEGREALEELWAERAGHRVRVLVPRRGEARNLVEMARRNASLALEDRSRRADTRARSLEALQGVLGMTSAPRRIECYDVSHLHGTLHVGSRVAFLDAEPDKPGYRRYKLRRTAPGDDYAGLREILERRFARLAQEPAPDLVLLDGGKGQLNAARAVLRDLGVAEVALAALAKEREQAGPRARTLRHGGTKREKLFLPGVKDAVLLAPDSAALLLLQRIRDESHRFAIRYHRELRRKAGLRSILDELPGIGPVKRRALLRTLGSLEGVRRASVAELAGIPKLSRADAELIYRFFHASSGAAAVKDLPGDADPSA
jgi:excinuclease ABC subunit C